MPWEVKDLFERNISQKEKFKRFIDVSQRGLLDKDSKMVSGKKFHQAVGMVELEMYKLAQKVRTYGHSPEHKKPLDLAEKANECAFKERVARTTGNRVDADAMLKRMKGIIKKDVREGSPVKNSGGGRDNIKVWDFIAWFDASAHAGYAPGKFKSKHAEILTGDKELSKKRNFVDAVKMFTRYQVRLEKAQKIVDERKGPENPAHLHIIKRLIDKRKRR